MTADIHPKHATIVNIIARQIAGETINYETHVVQIQADGNAVTAYMTIEQVEQLGHACMNHVRDYNAAAMVDMVEKLGGIK